MKEALKGSKDRESSPSKKKNPVDQDGLKIQIEAGLKSWRDIVGDVVDDVVDLVTGDSNSESEFDEDEESEVSERATNKGSTSPLWLTTSLGKSTLAVC